MTFTLTDEQNAIVSASRDTKTNLYVSAYAGCSKTTTLELIAKALPPGPALALAFNVKIKKELERRFPPTFTIRTLNGLGHQAWGAALRKRLEVDARKLGRITTQVLKDEGLQDVEGYWASVRELVTEAMLAGLIPKEFPHKGLMKDTPDNWFMLADYAFLDTSSTVAGLAARVLSLSIRESFAGTISFDDQIYMPTLFGGQFPRFPLVMVDEAQDLSVLNHMMVAKCAAGRLIIVGDPKQAIYGFRGADTNSMGKLRTLRPDWLDLPLTMTFRCPRSVVARQQTHAPGFRAFQKNSEGHVLDLRHTAWAFEHAGTNALSLGYAKGETDWEPMRLPLGNANSAVICRNNAPLLELAFKLIRRRIAPVMLGRDIGVGLIALAKKTFSAGDTREVMFAKIDAWQTKESAAAHDAGHEGKIAAITDRAESLRAVLTDPDVTSKTELLRALEDLFATENGAITLSTIHRAKGLEWEFVMHLDPWRVPSKQALRAADLGDHAQLGQENNLRYVCETRTSEMLALASLADMG